MKITFKNVTYVNYVKKGKKYGHLSKQVINQDPWNTICVDTIGTYSVTTKHDKELNLLAITICNPVTGWFEVAKLKDKTALETSKVLDQVWFCCHPRPLRCITDNGCKSLGTEFQELLRSYGIQHVPTTIKNPQANFVECVHQTLGNMIRTYELEKFEFDYNDPWSQLLSNCAWVIRSTVHSVLDATLAQIML